MQPRLAVPLRPNRRLRYVLTIGLVDARCPLDMGQLIRLAEHDGWTFAGRPSRKVSDLLRTEVTHGRVVRVGRGTYRRGVMPRSTEWWIREVLAEDVRWWRRETAA